MKRFLYLGIILLPGYIFSFSSCREKTIDVICDTVSLQVGGMGFDTVGYDSVIVTRYEKDNAFATAIDSAGFRIATWNDSSIIVPGTLQVQYASGKSTIPPGYIIPGFDYQLRFPAAGKSYFISDIVSNGKIHQVFTYRIAPDPPFRCYNNIVSSKVNGISHSADSVVHLMGIWLRR